MGEALCGHDTRPTLEEGRQWYEMRQKGRKKTGRSKEVSDRQHAISLKIADLILQGSLYEEAVRSIAKRGVTVCGKKWNIGEKTVEADISKARRIVILLDVFRSSSCLKNKHPEWFSWPEEFGQWCEQQRESLPARLEDLRKKKKDDTDQSL